MLQRLNTEQGEEPAGLHGAIHGLREASKSQGDAQLAGTLQECLQALIDSSDKASPGGSVRFKPSQEEHGTAPSGAKKACERAVAAHASCEQRCSDMHARLKSLVSFACQ